MPRAVKRYGGGKKPVATLARWPLAEKAGMSYLDEFKQKHGPPTDCVKVPEASLKAYNGRLPGGLLADWEENGWCAYGRGLLWTVNPDEYTDILTDWVDNPEQVIAYVRTAFGSIIYWDGKRNYFLDVLDSEKTRIFSRIDDVFNGTLCYDNFLNSVVLRPQFEAALPILGPPQRDECYGFHPAIALGGPGAADTLKRVKLREHLALLAQL
jgi:hypothetical protein